MSYFLSSENLHSGQTIEITAAEARHIALSRRSKAGSIIQLQGPDKKRFNAAILSITKNAITCRIENEVNTPAESAFEITVFQALIAEQALDIILQKATELGVAHIALFPTKHSPISPAVATKKIARWQKITIEATKQCDRQTAPDIKVCSSLAEAIQNAHALDHVYVLDPAGEKLAFSPKSRFQTAGLFIGPEGGMTEEERGQLTKLPKTSAVKLGPRILRAETAAIASITLLQHSFGDM